MGRKEMMNGKKERINGKNGHVTWKEGYDQRGYIWEHMETVGYQSHGVRRVALSINDYFR